MTISHSHPDDADRHIRPRTGRALWLFWHRQLALVFGIFFVLAGLTGSASQYLDGLDRFLNPSLVLVPPQSTPMLQADAWLANLKTAYPRRYGNWRLEYPKSPDTPVTAWFERPAESADEDWAPLMVSLNPWTGAIIAERFWGKTTVSRLHNWHGQLWLGTSGQRVVGLLALVITCILLSGLWLWRPRRLLNWSAYTVKPYCGDRRRLFDLHRLLGFYSAAILLPVCLSGFLLAYPEILGGQDDIGPDHNAFRRNVKSTAVAVNPINIAQAVLLARGLFPHARLVAVTPPARKEDTFLVEFAQQGSAHLPAAVWIDQYSGQIREVYNASHDGSDQFRHQWIHALHTGNLWGEAGRFLWLLAGAAPLLLFATGLLHWLHKRGWRYPHDRHDAICHALRTALACLLHGFHRMLRQCRNWRQP